MSNPNGLYGIRGSAPVTPSDSAEIAPTRAILVGVAGDVKVTYVDGMVDTLPLAASVWYPMQVKVIWDNGTDATNIHAGY
jgi:hypothetical protein